VGGKRGFILAPGCDLPYATPPANLEAVGKLVRDPYQQDVIRTLADQGPPSDILDMSEYGQTNKVIVDVITLDSESCAPCQYMVESVKAIAPEFEGIVEWREHRIKYRESLVFMTSLMVRNIPTIVIDGKITFVSRIPARDELIAAIQKRIYEKLRSKIQRRRGTLFILGGSDEDCNAIQENIERAIMELGADVEVRRVAEEDAILRFGVAPIQTPAVVMARYQLKSSRTIPEVNVIKEWIKQIV
jgi:uroporphyrinogen decarboxylase